MIVQLKHSGCGIYVGHVFIFCTLYSDDIALLHFTWAVDHEKCIVVMRVCLSACLHYCTDPDVTWRSGRGCPLVVHYWADLQSVHGLCCYGNTKNVWQSPAVIRQAHFTQCHTLCMPAKTTLTSDKIDAPTACAIPFGPYCGGVCWNVSEYMLVLALCLVVCVMPWATEISTYLQTAWEQTGYKVSYQPISSTTVCSK